MARPKSVRQSVPGLWRVLRYFWPWIRRERRLIAGSMLALQAGVLLRLAEPWPLKLVLDSVVSTDRPPGMNSIPELDSINPMLLLALCATAVIAVSGLRALVDYHQRVGMAKIGNRVLRRVRNEVFDHVHGLSLSFHNRSRTGDLIVRVTRDVSLLRDVTSTAMLPLAASLLILVGMFVVMLLLQWKLALLAMSTVPLFWISTVKIGRGIHSAARKQRRREGAMAATAAESITAIRDVQALSLGDGFSEDFASRNNMSQKEDLKTARLSAKLGRTVDVLSAISTAGVMWYGAVLVIRGGMTPGDLLVFLTYLRRAFKPAKDFAKHTGRLAKAAAAGERVIALLEQTPEVRDRPGAVAAPRFQGAVAVDGVSFFYEPQCPVLRDIDLRVEPGQTVAVTGPSGSGKSTLISLLLRLYDPDAGSVLIDGQDIRDFTLATLRSQISVVLQDTVLFSGTIGDNVACGTLDASAEQIEAAVKLAGVDEFVRRLPHGYETLVGERGVTLSRGERQRISIARAALRRAPILILDEPTTGLDGRNERKVSEALESLSRGATTILVTHDLKLAQLADVVFYLDRGQLVEQGAPDMLVAAGNRYAELHHLQKDWSRANGSRIKSS